MMEAVHRYGGYVARSTGDDIFALFGAPVATEDHPQRALWVAHPLTCDSFIHNTSPVFPGAQEV
jgi:class 3 adenylate cyclase